MKLFVMSVRDRATDSFGNPFTVAAVGQAVRGFADEINKHAEGNMLNMHPEDFDLYALGSFETDTGEFDVHPPRQISIGKDVVIKGGA